MKSIITREENGNIVLAITLPIAEVEKIKDAVIAERTKTTQVAGFRKGKAPQKIVEENLNPGQIREEVLKRLLPQSYIEAVNEHTLKPIMNPKVHVDTITDGEDWHFTATTCEMPEITLGKYKEAVQKITAKGKIIVPGKEEPASPDGGQGGEKPDFNKIMEAVLGSVKAKIPGVLIDQEVDRLLSQMLDEVKKLGLTLDQYLTSTKKSPEALRAEYAQRAENDILLEFALQKIGEEEKITVEDKEIEEAIHKAQDPAEKQHLESNKYMLSSILRQQKTLDFIRNL